MFSKLFAFFLVVNLLVSACAVATNTPDPGVFSTPVVGTPVPSTTTLVTPINVTTSTDTPTLTATSEPSPTPIPTSLPGNFEFPFQPGFIPAELEAGGLGEVSFGTAQSAGGEISTEGMKSQNIIPLVKDGSILNAVSGNVVFLPFPERMLTEDGQELTYSVEQSGSGWAAYVDTNGSLLRKMVTRITRDETIVAGVSFNEADRGAVYAVKLSATGEILGKASLVFSADSALSVVFDFGGVSVDVDGNSVLPDFTGSKWQVDTSRTLETQLAAQGVVFTTDTTSRLQTDKYSFTIRFSEGILKRSGVTYLRLAPQVLETMFFQAMGNFMFFSKEKYPDIYQELFANDVLVEVEGQGWSLNKASEFARVKIQDGPVPFEISENGVSGLINDVEMNLVSKSEFTDLVVPLLRRLGIGFVQRPEWINDPAWDDDSDIAAFMVENKLVIFSYNLGQSYERVQTRGAPLEILYNNPDLLYFGIYASWGKSSRLMQVLLAAGNTGVTAWGSDYADTRSVMCPGTIRKNGMVADCQSYIKYTFTRGLPVPSIPIPTPIP